MNGVKNYAKSVTSVNISIKNTSLIISNKWADCKTNGVLLKGEKFQNNILEGGSTKSERGKLQKLHYPPKNKINSEEKRSKPSSGQEKKKEKVPLKNPKKVTAAMEFGLLVLSTPILSRAINPNHLKYPNTPNLPQSVPREKQIEKAHTSEYVPHIIEKYVSENNDIFRILQDCYTVNNNELGFIAVEYNWKERHLKLEQGLNLLALCKNCDCDYHIEGVICPRGMFRNRNGYCPLDMELYKVKCPSCKQRIIPDESFGFGFYDCDFEITYKLVEQKEHRMKQEGSANIFYFRKLSVLANIFEYFEAQISLCTFV